MNDAKTVYSQVADISRFSCVQCCPHHDIHDAEKCYQTELFKTMVDVSLAEGMYDQLHCRSCYLTIVFVNGFLLATQFIATYPLVVTLIHLAKKLPDCNQVLFSFKRI